MAFYVLDENNNKVEAFDKEGVLAVLRQAIEDKMLENIVADSAFVSKLKCCIGGTTHNVAFVPQAKYNELLETRKLVENTYYIIIDDTTCEDIDEVLQELNNAINEIGNKLVKNIKTGTLNGEKGFVVELEYGKTYIFNIENTTYTLYLRPFNIEDEPNVAGVPALSTAALINNVSLRYLYYLKNVSNEGSKMVMKHRNLSTGDYGTVDDTVDFIYYEAI